MFYKGFLGEMGKTAKHVLITGHSGVGKSTRAKELSEELGLPLLELDETPEWRDVMYRTGRRGGGEKKRLSKAELYRITKKITKRALGEEEPHIIEGTQMLRHPFITKGHRMIVVDSPEDVISKQRFERQKRRAKEAGREWKPEKTKELGDRLLRYYRPRVERFKNMPGSEVYVPPHVNPNS